MNFYKLPLDFSQLFSKDDLERCSIEQSIQQQIDLLLASYFGEYKYDPNFGSQLREDDYKILLEGERKQSNLRTWSSCEPKIKNEVLQSIRDYEERLDKASLKVEVKVMNPLKMGKKKQADTKYINVYINGLISYNNMPFSYTKSIFLSPFSIS